MQKLLKSNSWSPFGFLWKLFDIPSDSGIWDSLFFYMSIWTTESNCTFKKLFVSLLITVLFLQDCIHSEIRHRTTCDTNSHSGTTWHCSCRCVVWPLLTRSHTTTLISYGTPASHNTKGRSRLVMNLGSSSEGWFWQWDPFSFGHFVMDEVRNCRSVLVKFLSSVFGLDIYLALPHLGEILPSAIHPSLWQHLPWKCLLVTLSLPVGLGLQEAWSFLFWRTLHAYIIVGSHEGREYAQWREDLKFLASEIIKLLLNKRNSHCYFYVPL